MKLTAASLAHLPKTVSVQPFDRAKLQSGIVHIGVGNYHRAHQSWYLDRLFRLGKGTDWSIIGAGVRPTDPALADWIDAEGAFPNSMVDGIVPATRPKGIVLCQSLGIDDAAPITHEPWRQWVIDDRFCAGRPDLEAVGVQFSDHVHAFERMKTAS